MVTISDEVCHDEKTGMRNMSYAERNWRNRHERVQGFGEIVGTWLLSRSLTGSQG